MNIRNKSIKTKNQSQPQNPIPLIEIDIIKWHFDRFVMFNKLKDEGQASVGDLRRFLSHYYTPTTGQSKVKIGLKNCVSYIRQKSS